MYIAMENNKGRSANGPITKELLDVDYVEAAKKVIEDILVDKNGHSRIEKAVTTTKVRNLFSLANDICNLERYRKGETLIQESEAMLKQMYVRVIFEYGRDRRTKQFIDKSKILQYINWIDGNRERLIRFAMYMEALVSFHRYYGGKEA